MSVEDGVVLDDDVRTAVGRCVGLVAAALHAESVVAGIHRAVHNESYVDVREVYGVAVLGVPRTAHGDAVHDDVLRVARVQVEFGRVLDGDALHQYVFAVFKAHQVVAQLLLSLRRVGNVLVAAQVVPRVPQFAAVALHAADDLFVFVPLHVAHLRALHGAPVVAVAVDDALAGNGYVLTLRGSDAGEALVRRLGVHEERLVCRHQYDGVLLQVQLDVVLQLDGSCQPDALRHRQPAAPRLLQFLDAVLKGLSVQRDAVADAAHLADFHLVGRNDGAAHLFHLCGQVLIVLRVVLCLCGDHHHECCRGSK